MIRAEIANSLWESRARMPWRWNENSTAHPGSSVIDRWDMPAGGIKSRINVPQSETAMESRYMEVILVERVLLFILGRWQLAEQQSSWITDLIRDADTSRRESAALLSHFRREEIKKEKKTAKGREIHLLGLQCPLQASAIYELKLGKAARADPLES
jgi:hypothetical protein